MRWCRWSDLFDAVIAMPACAYCLRLCHCLPDVTPLPLCLLAIPFLRCYAVRARASAFRIRCCLRVPDALFIAMRFMEWMRCSCVVRGLPCIILLPLYYSTGFLLMLRICLPVWSLRCRLPLPFVPYIMQFYTAYVHVRFGRCGACAPAAARALRKHAAELVVPGWATVCGVRYVRWSVVTVVVMGDATVTSCCVVVDCNCGVTNSLLCCLCCSICCCVFLL